MAGTCRHRHQLHKPPNRAPGNSEPFAPHAHTTIAQRLMTEAAEAPGVTQHVSCVCVVFVCGVGAWQVLQRQPSILVLVWLWGPSHAATKLGCSLESKVEDHPVLGHQHTVQPHCEGAHVHLLAAWRSQADVSSPRAGRG